MKVCLRETIGGTMKSIDVVVPCYNEEPVLNLFYTESKKVFESLNGYRFRYIFVNDGSKDNTLAILKDLAKKDINVKYISFSRNFGKESAMYAGLNNTNADYVVVMDADLEHPPTAVPTMIEKIEEGYDSCACMRKKRSSGGFKSGLSSLFYKFNNKFSDINLKQNAQDFRMMSRQMVNAVLSMSENERFTKGIFEWVGFETYWIENEDVTRPAGETKWGLKSLIKYAVTGITSFSISPLRFLTLMGSIISVLTFIMIVITFVRKIAFGIDLSGYASLMIMISFLGGIVEMSLGILGEYIGNIYIETKNRPIYITKDTNITDIK